MRDFCLSQHLCQSAVGDSGASKGVVKGAVHFHAQVGALFEDFVDFGNVELRDEGGARGVGDAVRGPEAGGVGF